MDSFIVIEACGIVDLSQTPTASSEPGMLRAAIPLLPIHFMALHTWFGDWTPNDLIGRYSFILSQSM